MKVAIIGAGPAGLLAAWGVTRYVQPRDVTIFDPSATLEAGRILGMQYLHERCTLPSAAIQTLGIDYVISGVDPKLESQVGFLKAAKYQYNAKLGRPLSEENSTRYAAKQAGLETTEVYSLRAAYAFLHGFFESRMQVLTLTWDQIVNELPLSFDKVISTAPLPRLLPTWSWPTMDMWITPNYLPVEVADGVCLINVDPKVAWTRATNLDGGKATEWAHVAGEILEFQDPLIRPSLQPLRKIIAPPRLPELPPNVFLAGRWGSWDAGVLTHHAYHRARNIMEGSVLK